MQNQRQLAGAPAAGDSPPPMAFAAPLHAVRRPPSKPWKKQETPPPCRVYRTDPKGFRRLVQALTGKPKSPALEELKWSPVTAINTEFFRREWPATADLEYWDQAGRF